MWWLALIPLALGQPDPPDATLVYYNARMALAEGHSLEAVKLWLLRNTLADRTGQVSVHDPDFHSVTWAALGDLGICQDGHPNDNDGAGIWPLGLHNWVVRNMGRKAKHQRPRPFDAFKVGRQQRFVSINDVLSAREMKEVSLFRGACARQRVALVAAGESVTADLSDRQVAARLMLYLLQQADTSLDRRVVKGHAAIEARRFDLYLQLAALSAREARQESRSEARRGRQLGLSRESVSAMKEEAPEYTFGPRSEPARILQEAVDWPVDEWMTLSDERRRFLFLHARAFGGDPATLDAAALGIIDELIRRDEGEEVQAWIGLRSADPATSPEAVWSGDRGQQLLSLDDDDGFGERSVIALHRGIQQLETGDLPGALRSMAYALQRSTESAESDAVARLSRRWMSYIAGQFEVTDELLVTLRELVPVRDYAVILEDLMWRAAFHADTASFERALRNQPPRGALERRSALLSPLAAGDAGRFVDQLRAGMVDAPSETLRFIDQMLERLELEDGDVRVAQRPTLTNLQRMLMDQADVGGRQARTVEGLIDRVQAIRDGTGGGNPWDRAIDEARGMSPDGEVFVGSVRLAPADPLPWPFVGADVAAPSVFEPLKLVPTMWRDDDGEQVFGWRIEG